jgi:hypothetical protein
MDSRSGLPMKNRRWRRLRITKRDNSSSLIFSRKIGFYSVGIRVYGATRWAQPTRARHPLQARPGGLSPTGDPADPETDAIKSYFPEKIREKELSCFTRRSRRHLLFFIGRPDLESVWGSGEGDLRSSLSPTSLHHQFHDAPHRE